MNSIPVLKVNGKGSVVGDSSVDNPIMNDCRNDVAASIMQNRSDLEKLLQYKEEWLLAISHEFKTPLTVINTAIQAIEVLCSDDLTPRLMRYIKRIKQNTFRQIRLVNNLIEIARAKTGDIRLKLQNMDIVQLTRVITESVNIYAKKKNIDIRFETNLDRKVISIDDEKYERILLNLLSNAIKFTQAGGKVIVSLDCADGKVSLCVRDTGIGIPAHKVDKLFTRFGQVESELSRQAEGTGIGLYLVRTLVESLGGKIRLHSDVDEGCMFTVNFDDKVISDGNGISDVSVPSVSSVLSVPSVSSVLSVPSVSSVLSVPSVPSVLSVPSVSGPSIKPSVPDVLDDRIQQAIQIEFADLYF